VTKVPQATANHTAKARPPATACGDVVDFTRLHYFHGRALGALDLRREQAYHLDKARLRNRLLHGWGIVCGLGVEIVPKQPCDPDDEEPNAWALVVQPGAALDCHGNEIVVRNPREVVLNALLSEDELRQLCEQPATVYLTLCFHEQPIDPSRPLLAAACEPVAACEFGRVLETYRICASTRRPNRGPACEPCCGACGDRCLELAAVVDFDPAAPIERWQLDLSGRRPLARHDLAEISAINWVHGRTYTREGATALLADGIEVRFSRPVQVASLRESVVELTTIEAGGGRSGGMYNVDGEFVGLPDSELTDRFVFRSTTDETLQYGDRVIITIRGDFIVDECCRAVDANHIGGNIPAIDDCPAQPIDSHTGPVCPPRPSGNGTEGGEFVSWIFVQERGERR
jgi:hypothetical protein